MEAFLKGTSSRATKPKAQAQLESRADKTRHTPWVEKYRPRSVKDVVFQDEVVSVLAKTIQGADFPNLLFYGPPGTGKTSTILAAARQLFGNDLMKTRVLELNASDERGIQVVRDKVKTFAQQAVSSTRPDGSPCPPLKIVILDEADSMTNSAQAALRRTMERESKTTRFCLICNYISRIIEPLTSRCTKFRFKPLIGEVLEHKLKEICDKEGVNCGGEAVKVLVDTSNGDMRKAITTLQSAARLKKNEEVTGADILEIAGVIPAETIDSIVQACYSDSYDKLEHAVKDFIAEGYSAAKLVSQIHDRIVTMDTIRDKEKSVIAERLGLVDYRLCDGADEYLQIMDLCSLIMGQFCHPQE